MSRSISFEDACARYVNRFTMEHVPPWAHAEPGTRPGYYAPHYRNDREWYDLTTFPGETRHGVTISKRADHCMSSSHTFPLGLWLSAPYRKS